MARLTDEERTQRRKNLVLLLSCTIPEEGLSLVSRVTQKEIADSVPGYEWNNDPKCHDHCPAIWSDIAAINLDPHKYNSPGIIISFNFEYWYGNREETKVYIQKLKNDLIPRLVRMNALKRYFKKHGQMDLFDECNIASAYIEEDEDEKEN